MGRKGGRFDYVAGFLTQLSDCRSASIGHIVTVEGR